MDDLTRDLECYLVGGAVRDLLLERPVHDRDWVVVGATQQQMLDLGFTQVGSDFPVFLHPQTHEEFALARTERKQGHGHKGFAINAGTDVTLEQDLSRRDLTINAMAMDQQGKLIDPFQGAQDIQRRILRHVTDAFAEDPLRVFRVARLAAQLRGFEVAPETLKLMRELAPQLSELSAERVWQELVKGLAGEAPQRFFAVLAACDGWRYWFVETGGLVPDMSSQQPQQRFAELALPESEFRQLSTRLRAPNEYVQCAQDYRQWGTVVRQWQTDTALLDALLGLQVQHRLDRLSQLCELLGAQDGRAYAPLLEIAAQLKTVRINSTATGADYGVELRQARVAWLAQRLATLA